MRLAGVGIRDLDYAHWAHEVFFFANMIAVNLARYTHGRARPKDGSDGHAK